MLTSEGPPASWWLTVLPAALPILTQIDKTQTVMLHHVSQLDPINIQETAMHPGHPPHSPCGPHLPRSSLSASMAGLSSWHRSSGHHQAGSLSSRALGYVLVSPPLGRGCMVEWPNGRVGGLGVWRPLPVPSSSS
ncbi:hypothetical protein P7K49_033743 [Saguinus oedipus]|uniref:Uncharacterized protein n=1 Tax=Saguinus oedipus TaxID=9490 RepID=A0ABQ9TST7_SAGOE|nr:hypothetical protein P7K49_033743 [Saguinus oedipus]